MAAEIISTVERRRRWPAAEKLRIMSEALEPGTVVAAMLGIDYQDLRGVQPAAGDGRGCASV